jgi:hypothetical protein
MHIVTVEFHHLSNLLTSGAVGSAHTAVSPVSNPHTVLLVGEGGEEDGRERERGGGEGGGMEGELTMV